MQSELFVDWQPSPSGAGFRVRMLLRLQGAVPLDQSRVPLNLSLVLDRSGSMSGDKLPAAQEAARFLVARLHPDDVVSVVAFDSRIEDVAEPGRATAQVGLGAAIDAIEPRGCTNLSGGWLRGREFVERHRRDGAVNRVILLTDGAANEGITEPAQLLGLARTAAAAGITTTTIGFGADFQEDLLRGMADAGGGNAWYIERPDQAPQVFHEEIAGLLSLSAQNVEVHLRPSAGVTITAVHNDWPARDGAEGPVFAMGDLYAREPKHLLVEFEVADAAALGASPTIATLAVRGAVLLAGGAIEQQVHTLPVAALLGDVRPPEPTIEREILLSEAAKARETSLRNREAGDGAAAMRVLRDAAMRLESSGLDDPRMHEQVRDLRMLATRLEQDEFDAADAKYSAQRAYNVRRGKMGYEGTLSRSRDPER